MKRAAVVLCFALAAHAQTRIASDVEIRQMEEAVRRTLDFATRVAAYVNLGELRMDRNEQAAAQGHFETALQLSRTERQAAREDGDLTRYATACAWSGVALANLGRGDEAFAVLEEGVRYAADVPGVWNLYSFAMNRLGRGTKAIGAARICVAAAERKTQSRATTRELLELNVHRFALAQGLLNAGGPTGEAEEILRRITESLETDALRSLRKAVEKREEFQTLTVPTTEGGLYLSLFNRSHMRLARLYELAGRDDKARGEYEVVLRRRTDDPAALAGLARVTSDPKESDRYLIQSLDSNPFAADVVEVYESHVIAGNASPAVAGGSVGSRVRLAIQQLHAHDARRARETLEALAREHPNNDVLQSLLARAALQGGDIAAARKAMASISDYALRTGVEILLTRASSSARPRFLASPVSLVTDPSESELRAVLRLFAGNTIPAEDRATLDEETFSSSAAFDGETFERGTIEGVPFRFQTPAHFEGTARKLRLTYRILGATTVDGGDALLLEPLGAEVEK